MKIFTFICGFFLLVQSYAFAAEARYSMVIEDLPLMAGMLEKAEEAVVFDKPGGRIVETSASLAAPAESVYKFYTDTLTPLGWKKTSASEFVRDNEKLKIDVEQQGGMAIVRFTLTPDSAGK